MDSVFIVEDDRKIRTELTKLLQKYGYRCYTSDDFSHMPDVILKQNPQLVLLDLNLPVYDGFYICRELRRHSKIPIIVVTSRSTDMDELMSMNFGADDFITKPYNTQILLARIAAVMARTYPEKAPDKISYRGLTVNFSQSVAEAEGGKAELTKNELRILSILLRNRRRITTNNSTGEIFRGLRFGFGVITIKYNELN